MSIPTPPQLQNPVFLPPVIHSVYIPNKPRSRQQQQNQLVVDSHIELLQRQHSYNHVDYELAKRMFLFFFFLLLPSLSPPNSQQQKLTFPFPFPPLGVKIQQLAQDQLLTENPHLEDLLIPSFPQTLQPNPSNPSNPPATPKITTTELPPTEIDHIKANQHPQRRAFGEMMRDGVFTTRNAQVLEPGFIPGIAPSVTNAKLLDNLKGGELSDSDSFVMIEEDDGHKKSGKKNAVDKNHENMDKNDKNNTTNKGYTISKHGVRLYENKKPPVGSVHKSLLCSNVLQTPNGVDLLMVEPGHEVCLINLDAVKHRQRGISIIKHGRRGKPRTCQLKLAQNCRYFVWESKSKDDGENVIRFHWITSIVQGQTSAVFQRNPDKRVEPLSISIHYSRPEKYSHIDESDDETEDKKNAKKLSFLPSFFNKSEKTASSSSKHSTWKGISQDLTLDMVIEDPNDWLIWYTCSRMLVDMSTNKLKMDSSSSLNRKTSIILSLPILSDYPSSSWIIDHGTGLTVKEQHENERQNEDNQIQVQLALTRKETYKELIRRTSSYAGGSQRDIRTQLIQRHESQRQINRQNSQININPTNSNQISSNSSSLTSTTLTIPNLSTPQQTSSPLENLPLNPDGTPDYSQIDDIDLLSASFPSPWRSIEIKNTSDIIHTSWIQQVIFFGPKAGRSVPWERAYTMSTTAATYPRVLERIVATQREAAGISGETKNDHTPAEFGRRERLYKSFLAQCQGLSIVLIRTRNGDVVGGYATAPWVEKWGFYGTPDTFVFSIGQEEVTVQVPDGVGVNHIIEEGDESRQTVFNPGGSVILDEKVCQTHIYRWCGNGRFFQFVSQDAFGFGSNFVPESQQNEQNLAQNNDNNFSQNSSQPIDPTQLLSNPQVLQIGSGAAQSTGPSLTLSRTLDVGYSLPCPIFHSPQLTRSKQWDCLQLEVWVPVPRV